MSFTPDWILTEGWQKCSIHSDHSGTIANIPNDDINFKDHARLIAAAPDLYEALTQLLEDIDIGSWNKSFASINKTKAALHRAGKE